MSVKQYNRDWLFAIKRMLDVASEQLDQAAYGQNDAGLMLAKKKLNEAKGHLTDSLDANLAKELD